ncbi:hypothetical protein [Consotaella salsifontis]|uniref:Uncharacterized protein n=1 Tax=Consotaella salsifontis TaxID=1365950 RepID=A0A1T4T9W8_9HYPH|nr:hypothetical protein [Consotaella salsifontis]SKA37360.1 hypothetical protein SAMN05428963_12220 [Consotaella salsifontis]
MKGVKAVLTISAVLALSLSAGSAYAGERHGTVSTSRGTASVDVSGGCANGSCSRSVNRTGPQGRSMSRQGSVSCDSNAQSCSGSRTTTGPNGTTVTRRGTVSRW